MLNEKDIIKFFEEKMCHKSNKFEDLSIDGYQCF